MFKYIKKILNNKNYRKIMENIISLFSLQGFNYILPLITFPYLTRVLGPDKFGLIAFATAFIAYFQILTDYGFNLSATKEISIHRTNDSKISEIYSSVLVTKIIFMLISLCLMSIIIFSFDIFSNNWIIYYFTFGIIIGNMLMPTWLFQGMEKMRYISILNMGASLISAICVFSFIRVSSDYIYVPLINSFGSIVMGIFALNVVKKDLKIPFNMPSFNDINHQIHEGWHLFISTFAVSLYTTSNSFILGLFVNNTTLGYYSVAETIMKSLKGLLTPINQSLYPYFSKIQFESPKKASTQLKKILVIVGVLSFFLTIVLIFLAPIIVKILAGQNYIQSIPLLQILLFIIFAVGINNILGIQGLVAFGYQEKFSKIVIFAGIIHLILLVGLILIWNSIGAAIAVVTTEFIICIFEYIMIKRLQIL